MNFLGVHLSNVQTVPAAVPLAEEADLLRHDVGVA